MTGAALHPTLAHFPAGGGGFALPFLTVGVFHDAQPTHRLAVGGDRAAGIPLAAGEGWVMPAGGEGQCLYDAPLDVTMVEIEAGLLAEVGLHAPDRIVPVVGRLDPVVTQMALAAEGFAAGGTLYRETMHRAFAAQLARALAPAPPESVAIDDARLRRAVDWIHDHLASDLSLEGMAGVAAMSPAHFARAFKAATGASPLQYVIGARQQLAQVLLRTTRLTVAEVAYRVGYADVSRFGQHFRRRTGTTPSAFREG